MSGISRTWDRTRLSPTHITCLFSLLSVKWVKLKSFDKHRGKIFLRTVFIPEISNFDTVQVSFSNILLTCDLWCCSENMVAAFKIWCINSSKCRCWKCNCAVHGWCILAEDVPSRSHQNLLTLFLNQRIYRFLKYL
jgi:hypothetical protein